MYEWGEEVQKQKIKDRILNNALIFLICACLGPITSENSSFIGLSKYLRILMIPIAGIPSEHLLFQNQTSQHN